MDVREPLGRYALRQRARCMERVLDMVNIGNDWDGLLAGEFEKEYEQKLRAFLAEEYRTPTRLIRPCTIFSMPSNTPPTTR